MIGIMVVMQCLSVTPIVPSLSVAPLSLCNSIAVAKGAYDAVAAMQSRYRAALDVRLNVPDRTANVAAGGTQNRMASALNSAATSATTAARRSKSDCWEHQHCGS
jgi:hypothetical protein